tara:strand:- start:123 stop:347 length:225 start_codon:yes stop_codon:yes gene_type:complete
MSEIKINKKEIFDYVDSFAATKISDIYHLIKEDCNYNSLPILNNPKNDGCAEFIKLIVDCLDYNTIYKDKNKID